MKVKKDSIKRGLRNLGLKRGDMVLVHSSLSSIGQVEGGAETVIKALLEVIGPKGTLVMPSFIGKEPFDINNTPTGLGLIPETFRRWPGVLRSLHPTHSVTAYGAKAKALIKAHIKSPTPCGRNTPYGRLAAWGGYILLIGVDQDRNTTLHTAEDYADAPYLTDKGASYIDQKGEVKKVVLRRFPGPHRNFIGLDQMFRNSGIMNISNIGNAVCRLIKAKEMIELTTDALRRNPAAVLCDNPNCQDCVIQRAKIRNRYKKQETFKLSLSTQRLQYDEAIEVATKYEIKYLELNNIAPGDLDLLRPLKVKLDSKGLKISSLYFDSPSQEKARINEAIELFNVPSITVPVTLSQKFINFIIKELDVNILLENQGKTSKECLEILQSFNSPKIKLAFNPAQFAFVKEKPFLSVFYHSKIKRFLENLYIEDGTFDKRFTLPGEGNGEIKELISILRCRNFSGFMTIRVQSKDNIDEVINSYLILMDSL